MLDGNAMGVKSVRPANLLELAKAASCADSRLKDHVEAELLARDATSESCSLGPCVGDDVAPPG
jgi:hypothetical protein